MTNKHVVLIIGRESVVASVTKDVLTFGIMSAFAWIGHSVTGSAAISATMAWAAALFVLGKWGRSKMITHYVTSALATRVDAMIITNQQESDDGTAAQAGKAG